MLGVCLALIGGGAHGASFDPSRGSLGLPQPISGFAATRSPLYGAEAATSTQPHPAVARIVVPEGNATSYGSGTLIDVREQFGLVVTNWHVVRDGTGDVDIIFPGGFRSKARPLKVDADWDLAALVIWRPPVAPVAIASSAPQPGDRLTICGYGSGQYRAATGRCTQYYAPTLDLPQQMVELDVEARQGDSGGPIFNDRGELAGVLFGAGHGTTLGSFGGRVEVFLATLAPDIGGSPERVDHAAPVALLADAHAAVQRSPTGAVQSDAPNSGDSPAASAPLSPSGLSPSDSMRPASDRIAALHRPTDAASLPDGNGWRSATIAPDNWLMPDKLTPPTASTAGGGVLPLAWIEQGKNVFAVVGAAALLLQLLRAAR